MHSALEATPTDAVFNITAVRAGGVLFREREVISDDPRRGLSSTPVILTGSYARTDALSEQATYGWPRRQVLQRFEGITRTVA